MSFGLSSTAAGALPTNPQVDRLEPLADGFLSSCCDGMLNDSVEIIAMSRKGRKFEFIG